MMNKVMCVANAHPEKSWGRLPRNQDRIYSIEGVAPCLALSVSSRIPLIMIDEQEIKQDVK